MPFNPKHWLALGMATAIMTPLFTVAAQAQEACVPVVGTLTSHFGPRYHPILREIRQHSGVDWTAPVGTPVVAAMSGTYTTIGQVRGFGNVVHLDHANGLQTRYRHLGRFSQAANLDHPVTAGDIIGYTGVSGRTGSPLFHFEMRLHGEPINPFGDLRVSHPKDFNALADDFVATIGGGNAGEPGTNISGFTESTWIRLIREHRPDLHAALSREDVLALRAAPALNRDMMVNLLQENASFLGARGHDADPGQLYLAFFLGPMGAHRVLSTEDNATVADILGNGVVRANPFLKDYTVLDIQDWADDKMRTTLEINPDATIPDSRQTITWVDDCGQ